MFKNEFVEMLKDKNRFQHSKYLEINILNSFSTYYLNKQVRFQHIKFIDYQQLKLVFHKIF